LLLAFAIDLLATPRGGGSYAFAAGASRLWCPSRLAVLTLIESYLKAAYHGAHLYFVIYLVNLGHLI
jgi:hypothetical protein